MNENKPIIPSIATLLAATAKIDRKIRTQLFYHNEEKWDNLTPHEKEVLETRFGINGRTKPPKVMEIENKFAARIDKLTEARKKKGEEEGS